MENIAYYNGKIGPIEEMTVPMNDRACFFADGVYDAAFAMNGVPLALHDHIERLYRSAGKVDIAVPMEPDALHSLALDLCRRVDSPSAMLYIQVSRGTGMRGHSYRFAGEHANLWLFVRPDAFDPPEREYRCITCEDTRFLHCDIKTLNLLPNVLYAQRAEAAGCDEAILHRGQRVTECAHSNVHILKNGTLQTAPLDHLILPGVTRKHLIAQCKRLGVAVEERAFTVEELMRADEVIFTNCGSLCCRVREIDGKPVGGRDGQRFEMLANAMWQEAKWESNKG